MTVETVAILTPGDMGHSVGNVLRAGGLRVVTCLRGRSRRTADLATKAGIEDVPDLETLVSEAGIILSILAPSAALEMAEAVAGAIRVEAAGPCYVDCNAVSPQTVVRMAELFHGTRARFVDAGIVGGPPEPGNATARFYASGKHASEFAELANYGLKIPVIGPDIGQASGLKMCYAAMTKGFTALATELLVAAQAMGLEDALRAEHEQGQQAIFKWYSRSIPGMPPKAYRWVGEMEEIASTFEHLGLTPRMLLGAADMYRFVGETSLGEETPESRKRGQTLDDAIRELASALPPRDETATA
jgi:3-hydroxyisobutyrate dehydrogenase-like beta-hydroxyacid dehydrogenase